MMPAAMIAATASPALRMSSKLAMMQRASCGLGTSLTVTSVITASMPSLPTITDSRSSPGASSASEPNSTDLALDREAAHAQHVVQRQPVLQAVHAAGVLGHVAADGAGDLAGRVGRVVQAVRRGGLADRQVAHAALHDRGAADRVDLEDLVELGQRQRHAQAVAASRRRTGRCRRRARPPARPGGGRSRSTADTCVLGLGQRHHQRPLAVGGQAVAFVGHGVFGLPQQRVGRQHAPTARRRPRAGGRHGSPASPAVVRGHAGGQRCVHWRTLARPGPHAQESDGADGRTVRPGRGDRRSVRAGEDRQHAGVAVEVVARDLAGGEEADQRHVAERVAHDLRARPTAPPKCGPPRPEQLT